ncbi:hypothetical protein TNCV_1528911 [Trichonephila clavipes]|uniref:Uncharacterized protein n=1 Tax=Trichonephila clavipes TaxID=2585209 RepID=A0A8X6SHT1_TRICX|nr:hypothetical protein TNCV_1528911 [Trichonephila clavipes]
MPNGCDPEPNVSNLFCETTSEMASELMVIWSTDDFHAAACKQFVGVSQFLMKAQRLKQVDGLNLSIKAVFGKTHKIFQGTAKCSNLPRGGLSDLQTCHLGPPAPKGTSSLRDSSYKFDVQQKVLEPIFQLL